MSSLHLHWDSSKKINARNETIVAAWHKIFEAPISIDSQYWTLCGNSIDDGKMICDCEADQLSKSGFIKLSQFYGVNYSKKIISGNRRVIQNAHWYCGDFLNVISDAMARKKFNPAIINADLTSMPVTACGYFSDLLLFLSYVKSDMMVVCNMVLEHQNIKKLSSDMEFVMNKLNSDSNFQAALVKADWRRYDDWYKYNGTGNLMTTVMGTIIFYKKENDNFLVHKT